MQFDSEIQKLLYDLSKRGIIETDEEFEKLLIALNEKNLVLDTILKNMNELRREMIGKAMMSKTLEWKISESDPTQLLDDLYIINDPLKYSIARFVIESYSVSLDLLYICKVQNQLLKYALKDKNLFEGREILSSISYNKNEIKKQKEITIEDLKDIQKEQEKKFDDSSNYDDIEEGSDV